MARFNSIQTSIYPFHITARTPNRENFPLSLDKIWEILENELIRVHYQYDLKIQSFVLMPNHFHLICKSESVPIGETMRSFLSVSSLEINKRAGRINQNWGGRHYKCLLPSELYFLNTYKYVYQNPLRANLVERTEDWKYSTLHQILGLNRLKIPLEEDTLLFKPSFCEKELKWINTIPAQENLKIWRLGLMKKSFKESGLSQRVAQTRNFRKS